MAWPSLNDYHEAIQSPRSAFDDLVLRSCKPECNQLGLPKPRAGAFAVAYKLQSPPGNWAVKCFTRQPPQDSQQRYAAIGTYLSQQHCPYTVDFTYLERGIRVGSGWYPVVKMQWAEGDPLHIYVQKNLGNAPVLTSLAIQWVQMIQVLQRAHIAHGDLQQGNVLVVNSALKLVDYDGMFVPALAGKRSTELGQRNYQHPGRTEVDFGPYLDNFSGWVIYVSLVALSVYPNLWQTFGGGDDCLLFRRKDFEDPDHSALLQTLARSNNSQVRDLVEVFKIALYSSPADVPSFENVAPLVASAPVQSAPSSVPSWVEDHVAFKSSQSSREPQAASPPDPSWVLDFLAPTTAPPQFGGEMAFPRTLLYACIVGTVSAIFVGWISLALALMFSCAFLGIIFACLRKYRSDPVVLLRTQSHKALRDAEHELRTARETIEAVEARKREVRSAEAEQVAKLTKEIQNILADEKKQLDAVDRVLHQATASALREKQRVDQEEAVELKLLQSTLGARVLNLTQQISQSQHAENAERAMALVKKQEEHIRTRLESIKLTPSAIAGIGPYVINNLIYAGIQNASDCVKLTHRKIPSVGPHRVGAILAWRQGKENQARRTMPTALNRTEDDAITAKYAASRAQLQSDLSSTQLSFATQQSSIQQKHAAAHVPFQSQIAAETVRHSSELQRIQSASKASQDVLQKAILRAHQSATQQIAEIEKPVDADALRAAVQKAQWHVAKARIENGKFRSITFTRYMRKVAIGY
jgi:hypothetical protein